ncbi:MAG: bifunctional phosphopantothenoylcysteine decarboxylase/phosphopantothenate--cysteine ligase CoaBC [Candidatus Dadabacteria bacterium]|nr:MAG: bifunctional phosphopantothenoylcysteine decarboxylase/phosphopantothenate--cysteine ligase CoaBC [Candidatus Dadabacteria bacterium]
MRKGRNIVLGITASIAAYKGVEIARVLMKKGYRVRCVMTESASRFITPLTFEAITGEKVVATFWEESKVINHISLAKWADLVLVAPATADFLAKISNGFADTPLSALLLATKAPILLAPAMNSGMYENSVTQANITRLKERGIFFVGPAKGELACRTYGLGKMSDVKEIVLITEKLLSSQCLRDIRVLVTAGPTREPIDPIRFISNRSSGKMGVSIALQAFKEGADVLLIHGKLSIRIPSLIRSVQIETAEELKGAILHSLNKKEWRPDIVIMTAAVCDLKPKNFSSEKIKKEKHLCSIELSRTPDILKTMAEVKPEERPFIVGFAVETDKEKIKKEAKRKLFEKKLNMVVANLAEDAFEKETNTVWITTEEEEQLKSGYKRKVAEEIIKEIAKKYKEEKAKGINE